MSTLLRRPACRPPQYGTTPAARSGRRRSAPYAGIIASCPGILQGHISIYWGRGQICRCRAHTTPRYLPCSHAAAAFQHIWHLAHSHSYSGAPQLLHGVSQHSIEDIITGRSIKSGTRPAGLAGGQFAEQRTQCRPHHQESVRFPHGHLAYPWFKRRIAAYGRSSNNRTRLGPALVSDGFHGVFGAIYAA